MHPRVWDLVDTKIQIRSIGSFSAETLLHDQLLDQCAASA